MVILDESPVSFNNNEFSALTSNKQAKKVESNETEKQMEMNPEFASRINDFFAVTAKTQSILPG